MGSFLPLLLPIRTNLTQLRLASESKEPLYCPNCGTVGKPELRISGYRDTVLDVICLAWNDVFRLAQFNRTLGMPQVRDGGNDATRHPCCTTGARRKRQQLSRLLLFLPLLLLELIRHDERRRQEL